MRRFKSFEGFRPASNYANPFGNAGALQYTLCPIPAGFPFLMVKPTTVLTKYSRCTCARIRKGKIVQATKIFADAPGCDPEGDVYGELENFLNKLIVKKPLREYGMVEAQIDEFTDMTITNQQRLPASNYVHLEREEIRKIFASLF